MNLATLEECYVLCWSGESRTVYKKFVPSADLPAFVFVYPNNTWEGRATKYMYDASGKIVPPIASGMLH